MSLINRSTRLLLAVCAVALSAPPALLHAQGTGIVTGVVSDSTGGPVAGARVSVDGATIATSSELDRTLHAPGSGSGHRTRSARGCSASPPRCRPSRSRPARPRRSTFASRTRPAELERVVVSTGYGQQMKANVTGSTEVIGGEEITKRPVSNITKGLQGFMPGVVVSDFGGRPGADGGQIRIRGASTLGDNGALILVDGVVGEINNLDPLDIESVSVLKDAASAAIYGARAANGVVMIKTRRGRNTGNLKLTYDGYVAQQKAMDMPERVDIATELKAVNESTPARARRRSTPPATSTARRTASIPSSTRTRTGSTYLTRRLRWPTRRCASRAETTSPPCRSRVTTSTSRVSSRRRNVLQAPHAARQHELQRLQASHGAGQPDADEREDGPAARRGRRPVPRAARHAADVARASTRMAPTAGARARSTRSRSSRAVGRREVALDHDVDQHAGELRDGERPQVRRTVLGRQQGLPRPGVPADLRALRPGGHADRDQDAERPHQLDRRRRNDFNFDAQLTASTRRTSASTRSTCSPATSSVRASTIGLSRAAQGAYNNDLQLPGRVTRRSRRW